MKILPRKTALIITVLALDGLVSVVGARGSFDSSLFHEPQAGVGVGVHWFVDCHFEASSLGFGRRHLVFLEPEVIIFGKEGDNEGESRNARRL